MRSLIYGMSACLALASCQCLAQDDIIDLAIANRDPDFSVQGEYVGPDRSLQVIALGNGEFEIVVWNGGLPGAGAVGDPQRLDGDADTVADLVESMELKRVERTSPTLGAKPPARAVVLFDGTQKSVDDHWEKGKLSDDGLLIPEASSKDKFQDYRLHVEFRTPWNPTKRGQGRGNSGVYHQGRFETQVLDSFGLTGEMNETGGIYSIKKPNLNMCLPPLRWQTYDVEFTAARFDESGNKVSEAKLTARLNGVIVQEDVELPHATTASPLKEGPEPGPIYLQDHSNKVRFRNIWVVPRDVEQEARRPIIPGFERFFASEGDSVLGGELLIANLACNACHAGESPLAVKRGPDLTTVRSRIRPDAIVEMIRNPHESKVGTTMPDPWVGLSDAERETRANAIASYLVVHGKGQLEDRRVPGVLKERGEKLFHSVGCTACHSTRKGAATPHATSVPLGSLEQKYTVSSLAEFLLDPHAVRPGTRMPGIASGSMRRADAYSIATYLMGDRAKRIDTAQIHRKIYFGGWEQLPNFAELTPDLGDTVKGLNVKVKGRVDKYGIVFEAKLPIPVTGNYRFTIGSDDGSALHIAGQSLINDGIHGFRNESKTFALEAGVHPIRIEFFEYEGGEEMRLEMEDPDLGTVDIAQLIISQAESAERQSQVADPGRFQPNPSLVAQGRAWFASSGCAQCHSFDDAPSSSSLAGIPFTAIPLDAMRIDRGCLSADVQSPAVEYQLSPAQRSAIVAAINSRKQSGGSLPLDDATRVHLTMADNNCYVCHRRGNIGGPEASRDQGFQTAIPEMGSEGRLPPALDGVGDKLRDAYVERLLDTGGRERTYMGVQMPAFDYASLKSFHQAINRLDRKTETVTVSHDIPAADVISSGRKIVGNRGLACIKCHAFGGNKGGGIGAMDMLNMTNRLRVQWFHRYLQDPTKYRPGTRMPNSFPDGKSAYADMFNADPARQIDAMWQYLLQGENAKEPAGLKAGAIVLVADGRPRIYRNFFTGQSGRGIAVAYPGDLNLIWDAERMSLSQLWKYGFIDASKHWVGRGPGRQTPLGDNLVALEQLTPLASLESVDTPWPSQSGRDQGFRFRGYSLDPDGNPSFRYSMDDVQVTDAVIPISEDQQSGFDRKVTITRADGDERTLVWLFGQGKIHASDSGYQVNGVELTVDGVEPKILAAGDQSQLRAEIPAQQVTVINQSIRW